MTIAVKDIIIGAIPTFRNLAVSRDDEERLALASCLVLKKTIRVSAAAMLMPAVNPMAATLVMLVIVLVVTVEIISFSL